MINSKKRNINIILPIFLSFIGFFLLCLYIKNASSDIIYSDYIRLTNSYLDNVYDINKLFTLDLLTRSPICYLFRIINVILFSYSVNFDRVVLVFFLSLFYFIIAKYILREKNNIIKYFILLATFLIIFSLCQWEMILNGSGYAHYIAYFLFILYFYYANKYCNNINLIKSTDETISISFILSFVILPIFNIIFVAGPYSATFVVVAIILNIYIYLVSNKNIIHKKKLLISQISIIIPFILYLISNHFAIYEHSGMKNITLFELFKTNPTYIFTFLIKSVASSAIGIETFNSYFGEIKNNNFILYLIGILIAIFFIISFIILLKKLFNKNNNFKEKNHITKNIFPICLIIMGFGNFLIVFLGRFPFLNDTYGMQSRYYLQYMIGIIGLLLFFYENKKTLFFVILSVIILIPNVITTSDEIKKAKFREISYENIANNAKNIENLQDEDLPIIFEYNHDPKLIRDAFNIIKEKKYNIYKNIN